VSERVANPFGITDPVPLFCDNPPACRARKKSQILRSLALSFRAR
jgi:hypothetical protein